MEKRLCDVDGKAFHDDKSAYEHNKVHLGKKHECIMCQKIFATENYLKKHVKVVHFEGQNNCKDCQGVFITAQNRRNFKKKNVVRRRKYSFKVGV